MKRGAIEHPKTLALSEALNIPLYAAVGILECLWQWTAKYAPSGDIGKWPDSRIADGVFFERTQCAQLAHALRTAGFVDAHEQLRLVVHDWPQHCEDAVHMALARRIEYFWDGTRPSLSRLSEKERTEINKAYLNKPFTLTTVRTESAQEAHGVRTALASASASALANALNPPIVPHSGDVPVPTNGVRKRKPAKSTKYVTMSTEQETWFQWFWDNYPNAHKWEMTRTSWNNAMIDEWIFAEIQHALEWQKPMWAEKDNKYCPGSEVYLNQRRWKDKPKPRVAPKSAGVFTNPADEEIPF